MGLAVCSHTAIESTPFVNIFCVDISIINKNLPPLVAG